MQKRIILIGASGFFGINIYNYFKSDFVIKKVFRKTNIKKINFKNYDYIINASADVYNEGNMFKNNTLFVFKILKKIIDENKNIKLIHFGSSGEYGAVNKMLCEKDLLVPRTVYESTKAAATMLVSGYSKYYKINSIIIRPFAIYGIHENETRILPNFFRHFLHSKPLKIYKGYQDYVYIKDLLLFLQKIIKKNYIKNWGEIVNFGSGKQHSNTAIFNICKKAFRKEIVKMKNNFFMNTSLPSVIYINNFQKIYHKKIWCSNNKYLLKNFKFNFKYNIEKGIKDYVHEYKKLLKIKSWKNF